MMMRNKRKINSNPKEIKMHTIIDLNKISIKMMKQEILIQNYKILIEKPL
jgi:hypothetical protein